MQRVRKTNELLAWINKVVDANLQCMEDIRGGAFIVQIFHSLYPFDLSKVDFISKNEYHYERNYKLLQQVFTTYKIEKDFNISNMLQGEKKRDLYYFLMWIQLHYDTFAAHTNFSNATYRATEERANAIAIRKKRASQLLCQQPPSYDEECSSPRSSSTRGSIYSQLSAFTTYSGRFHAKLRGKGPNLSPQERELTASALAQHRLETRSPITPVETTPLHNVWDRVRVALQEEAAMAPLVTADHDWWAPGKVPGTVRVIPRTTSGVSSMGSLSIVE
jgi:hypothetical protein